MNEKEILEIIEKLSEKCNENFDRFAVTDYTLAGLNVIVFHTDTVNTRKVSDWGTDEDEDIYLWFSKDGWEFASQVMQVGAGVQKLVSNYICKYNSEEVVKYFFKLSLGNRLGFLHKAYEIINE